MNVYSDTERSVVRLGVDLRRRLIGCEACRATQSHGEATLTLQSTRVGPVTENGWALVGTLSSRASTTGVESALEVRGIDQRIGELAFARLTVRTPVAVAALGLCDSHRLAHAALGCSADLLTHLLATRDATE